MSTIEQQNNLADKIQSIIKKNNGQITGNLIPMSEVLPMVHNEASVMELAAIIAGSRDFPACRTPEKAAVRIMAGRELGIGPIAAVDGVRIENGKICTSAAVMESIIDRSHVYDWKLIERNAEHCAIEFFRNGVSRGTIDYTMENARTAGLLAKTGDNWKKHPEAMLFAAAFRTGARAFCAGAFNGNAVYTYDELGVATDEDGNAVESGDEAGNDLCTREQRQTVRSLAEQLGKPREKLLEELGVAMLDELSAWEAAKLIKKLENQAAKLPAEPAADKPTEQPQTNQPVQTPAQQTMSDAFDESRQPSTPEQRDEIFKLAVALEPNEDQSYEMMVAVLEKRGCKKVAELNHLQAAALIEAMQAKFKKIEEAKNNTSPFAQAK